MTEWLFDIFGDRLTTNSSRSIPRQPLTNNENFGKTVTNATFKPNEPLKKAGDVKKSFLCNSGKVLRDIQTPANKVYSPRNRNIESSAKKVVSAQIIYNDELDEETKSFYERMEFTKPFYKYDNYHKDVADYILEPALKVLDLPAPSTPPPAEISRTMDFDCSYEDDFFTDDFSRDCEANPFGDDDLPAIYSDSD